MRLRSKFTFGITFIVTLAVLAVGSITIYSQQKLLTAELKGNYERLAQQLARVSEEALYQSNLVFVNYVQTLKKERGFRRASFVDNAGVFQFHSDLEERGKPFVAIQNPDTWVYSAPVSFSGQKVGNATLEISAKTVNAFLNKSLRKNVERMAITSLIVLAGAWLFVFLFANAMIRPIQRVINGMREVSKGRREPISFPRRRDELGWMGEELNQTISKLRELDDLKHDFVMGVTHDLTSPLKAIQSVHAMLLGKVGKQSDSELRESLLNAENSSLRLMKMIEDLLQASRIESGRQNVEMSLFDVRKCVREVQELYTAHAQEKGLKLESVLPDKPTYIEADRDKMEHILTNLVSNAFKFTTKGKIVVSVEQKSKETQIRVADTGTGIPVGDRAKIFDKFYRSQSNAKFAKGTGLGLFIVKGMVDAQNARIGIEDNVGGGTVFVISFPNPAQNGSPRP